MRRGVIVVGGERVREFLLRIRYWSWVLRSKFFKKENVLGRGCGLYKGRN